MALMYEDYEYAADRLCGCVVRYEDKPVYVDHMDHDQASIMVMGGSNHYQMVDYKKLDLTPVPLGNVNINGGVVFAKRMPKRRDWRQGLRSNNMTADRVIGDVFDRLNVTGKHIANTIMGVYPSIYDCINHIECGEAEGMAFSRHFSVGPKLPDGYTLYYRKEIVGTVSLGADKQTVNTSLDEKYKFLQEYLAEEIKIG